MDAIPRRRSPVIFDVRPDKIRDSGGWRVVQKYGDEGSGPHLVDLSHLPRWDLQDSDLSPHFPVGVPVPETIGTCAITENAIVSRMNRTQAGIWHLAPGGPGMPDEPAFTDIRENTACLAVLGPQALSLSEKVCRLDLSAPGHHPPCLLQGPLGGVPCQVVLLENQNGREGFVFTFSRGYCRDMVKVLLAAGREFGLRPAGEDRMSRVWDDFGNRI